MRTAPSCRRRTLALLLALLAWGSAGCYSAQVAGQNDRIENGTGWLGVHTGASFAHSVLVDQQLTIDGTSDPAPVFGIQGLYRTSRFDFGLLLEGHGSFRFKGQEREFRAGSAQRSAALVRWRYVDAPWGALFLRLSPGLVIFNHSNKIRSEIGNLRSADLEDVDSHSFGFTLGFDMGLMIYVTDSVGLTLDLDVVTGTAEVDTGSGELSYTAVRGILSLGVEWKM